MVRFSDVDRTIVPLLATRLEQDRDQLQMEAECLQERLTTLTAQFAQTAEERVSLAQRNDMLQRELQAAGVERVVVDRRNTKQVRGREGGRGREEGGMGSGRGRERKRGELQTVGVGRAPVALLQIHASSSVPCCRRRCARLRRARPSATSMRSYRAKRTVTGA